MSRLKSRGGCPGRVCIRLRRRSSSRTFGKSGASSSSAEAYKLGGRGKRRNGDETGEVLETRAVIVKVQKTIVLRIIARSEGSRASSSLVEACIARIMVVMNL